MILYIDLKSFSGTQKSPKQQDPKEKVNYIL